MKDTPEKTIVVFHASPRRGGETDMMVRRYLSSLRVRDEECAHLYIDELLIQPCTACCACHDSGPCVIRDDIDRVMPLIEKADLLVVATPVYFNSVPGPLKTLIDRMHPLYVRKYLLKEALPAKKAVLLVQCDTGVNDPLIGVKKPIEAWFFTLNAELIDTCFVQRCGESVTGNQRLLHMIDECAEKTSNFF